jgi:hypothetical protein
MILLVCHRCYWHIGRAAQERIDKAAKTLQVIQRADEWRTPRCRGIGLEIRPLGGNQRLAAVGQNKNELQAGRHAGLTKDLQGLSLKWMMGAGDRYPFRKVLTVGSVWCFPSTT